MTLVQKIKYKKYLAYKDSGVEWLGEIPEGWELLANKNIFRLKKVSVGKKSKDFVLLSLTLKGVIVRDMINTQGKFPAEFDTYQEVKKGDFIFCMFDVEETPRAVGLSPFDGMITGAYTIMRPSENFHKGFLYYFYLNLDTDKRMKPLYTGLRNTISKENFFSFKTFIPPLPEQTAIATFLDNKTTKIDQAIAQKQKLIELLKERKQILIQNAVTGKVVWSKKHQKFVPLALSEVEGKDSGVEWIGEIPEGWEVKSFKHIAYLESGQTISSESFIEKGYPVYGGNGFRGYATKYTNEGDYALIGRQGALCGNVNYASGKFFASEHAIVVYHKKDINVLWLGETIKAADFNRLSQSAAQPGIAVNVIKNEIFPYPPIKDQNEISVFIQTQSTKIDKAIALQQTQIEKLKEYKATLIDSAVRGRIRVS